MEMAPYPEYKDAGVSWVGRIPAHWPEKRAKYYFKEIDDRSQTGDEEMLSVSHITGVTPRSQKNVTMFKAESNVGQKRCQPGDLVINTMWAWMSALGVSNYAGIVSPAYGVYRPRSSKDYDYYYLDNLLRIEGYRSEYICRSTGIRSSRLRLYPDKFLSMPVVCPPREEQHTIARFLKAQDRLFRKFIHNKRRLIVLLKEQKQNVINQAVTRGLDPNVKFKYSGVDWIGDIPVHWETSRIKELARPGYKTFTDGDWIETPYITNEGIRLIQTGNIGRGTYREQGFRYISRETFDNFRCTGIDPEDILICRLADPVARACLAPNLGVPMVTSVDVCILKPRKDIVAQFVVFALTASTFLDWVASLVRGSTRDRVSRSMLGSFRIPMPPHDEQVRIIEHLDSELVRFDSAIRVADREVELMREYRSRLISDVVTGQVDVRGIEVSEVTEEELLALAEGIVDSNDVIDDERDMDETD